MAVARELEPLTPLCVANPRAIPHELKPVAEGRLVERFGYETDEPAARFFLRDLVAEQCQAHTLAQQATRLVSRFSKTSIEPLHMKSSAHGAG